ncbi:sulfite exporter TauE/SafE family protein, partial [Klebsiella pneumoniae]
MIALLLLFFVALGAGVLSGVVGTGSSLIMLPVLVATYGPRIAVPVMAIASLFGNIGRVIVW